MRMFSKMTMSPIPKVQNHRNISPPSTPTSSISIRQSPSLRMYSIIMTPRMSPVIRRKGIPFWALIISFKMIKTKSISTKKMMMRKCSPKTIIYSVTMSTIKNNSSLSHKSTNYPNNPKNHPKPNPSVFRQKYPKTSNPNNQSRNLNLSKQATRCPNPSKKIKNIFHHQKRKKSTFINKKPNLPSKSNIRSRNRANSRNLRMRTSTLSTRQ
jgi:hypothetical protein